MGSRLASLLRSHPAGVGECGLDFARKDTNRATQEAAFRAQLRLAHDLHRPLAMHVVRAWGRIIALLREEAYPCRSHGPRLRRKPRDGRHLQSMGLPLLFGRPPEPDRWKLRESLRAVAAGHLLLETDGTANPIKVLEGAARIRDVTVESLAAQTWENGQRCFRSGVA